MIESILEFNCDLLKGPPVTQVTQPLASYDKEAHTFRIRVYRGRESISLDGAIITGHFVRPDRTTVVVGGTVENGAAEVTLPADCYQQTGAFGLVVKAAMGSVIHTIFMGRGTVLATGTDEVTDPGEIIPSLEAVLAEIAAMDTATVLAEAAADAAQQAAAEAAEATTRAETATGAATEAASAANTAAQKADTAAAQATEQAAAAQEAAGSAREATADVTAATAESQTATAAAREAAEQADSARDAANTAAAAADTAREKAETAASEANTAAENADTARGKTEAATTSANTAASAANTAAASANKAASAANTAASGATTAKTSAETAAGKATEAAAAANAAAENADQAVEYIDQIDYYEGVDLTQKFADEIEKYSDPWAWIQARMNANKFSGLHVCDYIPFTTTNGYAFNAQIGGINTYYKTGTTPQKRHIDFITKESWPEYFRMNLANYNNGTEAEPVPWLASNGYLYVNSLAGQVPNSDTLPLEMVDVDYTTSGIYYYLPDELKAVIAEKEVWTNTRYSASGLLQTDNSTQAATIGKLWLLDEIEIHGRRINGTQKKETNIVQYPIFANNANKSKYKQGTYTRVSTWQINPMENNSGAFCIVSATGVASGANANDTGGRRTPICFRIQAAK